MDIKKKRGNCDKKETDITLFKITSYADIRSVATKRSVDGSEVA